MKDPNLQLEQLRRNSLLGPSDLKLPSRKIIPDRKMPGTVASVPEEALTQWTVPLEAAGALSDEPPVQLSSGGSPHSLGAQNADVPEALPLLVGGEEAAKVKDAVAFSEPNFEASDKDTGTGIERVEVVSPTPLVEGS